MENLCPPVTRPFTESNKRSVGYRESKYLLPIKYTASKLDGLCVI